MLEDVSLRIETGDILGIFGRNGSGKSTLLQMLFGTLKSNGVELHIDGAEVNPSEVIQKQHIGYLPQQPFLPKNAKVRDLIPIYHTSQEKQDAVFYDPHVAKIAAQRVRELSHGERKYFELILLGNMGHPFLMLDEPFSMLEPLQIIAVKEFLLQLSETKGILITDHYYNDVLDSTTHNSVLKDHKLFGVSGADDLRKFEYLRK